VLTSRRKRSLQVGPVARRENRDERTGGQLSVCLPKTSEASDQVAPTNRAGTSVPPTSGYPRSGDVTRVCEADPEWAEVLERS